MIYLKTNKQTNEHWNGIFKIAKSKIIAFVTAFTIVFIQISHPIVLRLVILYFLLIFLGPVRDSLDWVVMFIHFAGNLNKYAIWLAIK